jgi:signal transduction histidine kinase
VSIRTRLLMLVIGTVIPILIFGLVVLWEGWHAKQQQLNDAVEQQAKLTAVVFERWLESQQQTLVTITSQPTERLEDNDALKDYMQRVLVPRLHWIDLRVIDSQGKTIIALPKGTASMPDGLIDKMISEVRSKGRVVETYWIPGENDCILTIAVPVDSGGTVIARVQGIALKDIFTGISLADQALITLLDGQRHIIFSSENAEKRIGADLSSLSIFSPLEHQVSMVVVVESPVDGIERVYGLARVGETGFIMSVGIPSTVLYTPARQQFTHYSLISLLVIISTIAAAILISRSIAQPVRLLSLAVNKFAQDDFSARAPSSGEDEISRLGANFNSMAEHLQKREAHLAEIDRLKSDFVSGVSHELRTPLTTIKALTRLLMRGGLTEAKRQEYLETIALECDRQIDLVLNLLDLSRIEGGVFKITRERVDVAEVLTASIKAAARAADARGHELSLEQPVNIPAAFADRKALRRVLGNIIENAIKYTPNGGRIILSACKADNKVAISVADNGIGIAPEDLPPLFDKFHRGRRAVNAEAQMEEAEMAGVGLGLYLARNIIEQMGGSISVESKVGHGSTFTIYLPLWPTGDSDNQINKEHPDEQTVAGC